MENAKDIVKKYGFKFRKSLGQNFLVDDTVLSDIITASEASKDDFVIEIGPGVGTLTKELLKSVRKVCAIEIDDSLIPILEKELQEYDNFELVHMDALQVDFNELIGDETSVKVVANLPYYVTTPIISKLLTQNYKFESLTVMIQKEVGERIAAEPGCKEYGALSLLVQFYCDAKIIRKVPPTSFIPQPKVDSVILKLDKLKSPKVSPKSEKLFFRIIRDSFNMRRKTLRNSLKTVGLTSEQLSEAFENSQIDPIRRGETLSIQEFSKLSDSILSMMNYNS